MGRLMMRALYDVPNSSSASVWIVLEVAKTRTTEAVVLDFARSASSVAGGRVETEQGQPCSLFTGERPGMPWAAPALIVHRPSLSALAVYVTGDGWIVPSRKTASTSSALVKIELGALVAYLGRDQCSGAGEQVAVSGVAAGALQALAEEEREGAPALSASGVFLGFLVRNAQAAKRTCLPSAASCQPVPGAGPAARAAAART